MSSIQSSNFNYKSLLEPTAFVSLALLAGFTRVIEYVPGASRRGILLSGGLAATGSITYTHTRFNPERSYARTLLEKIAVLALANISALLLAKPLEGRLSLAAAGKLGCIQCVCTAIATKWNAVVETPLQKKHRHYNTHQKEWRDLSVEDRTQLAKQFYEAGLSGICLFEARIDVKVLNPLFAEYLKIENLEEEEAEPQPPITDAAFETHLDSLSSQQLSWLREILQGEGRAFVQWPSTAIFYALMQRFHDQGIETVRTPILDTPFLQKNPKYLDLLYKEFQKEPICVLALPEVTRLFENKPPLPAFEDILPTLSKEKIQTMDPELIKMWHHGLQYSETLWNSIDPSIQSAFVHRFVEYKNLVRLKHMFAIPSLNIQWLNDLSQKELEELSSAQTTWLATLLNMPKLAQQLSFKTIHALNTHHYDLDIPYALTHEVVVAAKDDPKLVATLYKQTWRPPVEVKGQEGPSQPYFDLTGLSPDDQEQLLLLFNSFEEHEDY